jgi:hypothetical protein
MDNELLAVLSVGLLWGVTNPLIARGAKAVRTRQGRHQGALQAIVAHITCPGFIIPQLVNQSASLLFVWLLGSADLSVVVPVSNATALLFNAITDVALGQRYAPGLLSLGVLLISLGVLLSGLPAHSLDAAWMAARSAVARLIWSN